MTNPSPLSAIEKYEAVVARVVAAVPECGTIYCPWKKLVSPEKRSHATFRYYCGLGSSGSARCYLSTSKRTRQIHSEGRDPTLEDVLRSMDYQRVEMGLAGAPGKIFVFFPKDKAKKHGEWTLGQSLSWHRDNAPETIDFLYNLLH